MPLQSIDDRAAVWVATHRIAALNDPSVWLDLTCRFRCDVFCGLFVTEGNEGAELHPRVLSMLVDRGLRLGLDIYTCSD